MTAVESIVPKAEMHVHLEACARPALAREMAAKYGTSIEDVIAPDGESYAWDDFTDFLTTYSRVADLFRTADDYAVLTETYLAELAASGTIYAEIIVWPDHPERLGLPADDYLAGIAMGVERHRASHGDRAVETRLLVTGVRHEGAEAVERAARWAAERADHGLIVGFGLAGDERVGHPAEFVRAFAVAREAGLGLAAHAGELCAAQSVRDALDHLHVARIDHGVRAAEDPDLVRRLVDEGTLLTVCVGSNLALGVFRSLAGHPLPRLVGAGCRVALGSDDPPHFGTSLAADYALAAEAGVDARALTATAIEGAFCDEATKARLRGRIAKP